MIRTTSSLRTGDRPVQLEVWGNTHAVGPVGFNQHVLVYSVSMLMRFSQARYKRGTSRGSFEVNVPLKGEMM